MAVDGTGDRPLFDRLPSGCYGPGHVSLSPADESILIVQCVPKTGSSRLIVMTTDGDLVRRLPTGHVRVDDPSLSPDGRTVAYWASDVATGQTGGSIYTIGIDESAVPVALTESAAGTDADPAWTPDGKSIAFRRSINDNWDVYQMGSDGSNVRPLVTGPDRDHKPAWSPDGKQLMIISNRDAKDQTDDLVRSLPGERRRNRPQTARLLRAGDLDSHLVAPVAVQSHRSSMITVAAASAMVINHSVRGR